MPQSITYSAFFGDQLIASGRVGEILPVLKARFDRDPGELILVFNDATGWSIDFDLRGSLEEVVARYAAAPEDEQATRRSPGRPKLGVISREVSLLPRHWEWLEQQPNGASAAIRRLVEEDRRRNPDAAQAQQARTALAKFMSAMAGNRPGYEEASRALFAGDRAAFEQQTGAWPTDIRAYLARREGEAFWTSHQPSD